MSMYLEHFGLREPPFRITPHTDFFFAAGNRGATLDALVYAVTHDEGIVKVTGEVGSGKTMLCRMLLERLPPRVETLYLANPALDRTELFHALADELRLPDPPEPNHKLLRALQRRFVELYAAGRQTVVLVDEAHAMPADSLEALRLLSNLESNRHKLVQIVLFGQPELDGLIGRGEMRPLRERITHNFALEPLNQHDIVGYLDCRLRAAGYPGAEPLFAAGAVKLIADASAGLTRRINIISDKAMLAAFAQNSRRVEIPHARAAIEEARFGTASVARPEKARRSQVAAALGMVIVAATAAAWAYALNVGTSDVGHVAPHLLAPVPSPRADPSPVAHTAPQSAPQPAPPDGGKAAPGNSTAAVGPASTGSPAKRLLQERQAAFDIWLARVPDDHYFIQLLRTRADSTREIESFLDRVAPKIDVGQLRAYRSTVDGQHWIGIVYGDFPSREAATKAIHELPSEARTSSPYARRVAGLR